MKLSHERPRDASPQTRLRRGELIVLLLRPGAPAAPTRESAVLARGKTIQLLVAHAVQTALLAFERRCQPQPQSSSAYLLTRVNRAFPPLS